MIKGIQQPYPIRNVELLLYLMDAKGKNWVFVNDFFEFLNYLYQELQRNNQFKNYRISFGTNMGTLKKNVYFDSRLFVWSCDEDAIVLRKENNLEQLLSEHPIPVEIGVMIQNYHKQVKCQTSEGISCGNPFPIKQEEVFANLINGKYFYYQMCPYCGNMVMIPEEKLSKELQEQCQKKYMGISKVSKKSYSHFN